LSLKREDELKFYNLQAVLKNHQRLGDIVTEIEKTQKSCNEIRQQIEQLTQNIASLKSSTHDRVSIF
jgi:hypothetical protein